MTSVRITAGSHRGLRLRSVKDPGLRPTSDKVRAAIFSILGEDTQDARVLDLYAGTGALGIEALSRGAAWVGFVEANGRRAQRIRENLRELSLTEKSSVHQSKVEDALDTLPGRYDLVLADPPYRMRGWDRLMIRLSEGELLEEDANVVIEHRFDTDLAGRYERLSRTDQRRYGDTMVSFYRMGAANG